MTPTEQIDRFLARARELSELRLLRNWSGAKLNIRYDHIEGLRAATANPDEEDLRSYLVTLRQFLSESEPVFLGRIHNLVFKHLSSDELRSGLARARGDWARFQLEGPIRIQEGTEALSPERITDMWINGVFFHNSDDRRHLERLLAEGLTGVLTRHVLLDYVTRATNQVAYVNNVTRYARAHGLLSI